MAIASPSPATGSIVDAIRRHAREQPDSTAVTFLADHGVTNVSITFGEIEERSRAIAWELLDKEPNAERAMVLQGPGLDFVLSLCACFIAGVAAVPTPVPTARASSNAAQRFARLLADAAPDIIVTHSALLARSRWLVEGQIGLAAQKWVISDGRGVAADKGGISAVTLGDLALLQYTSGSTTEPKGVLIDHANLAANLSAIQSKFELNEDSVVVNWLPPYHDMGLIGGIIAALWCGYHVVLMDPAHFIKRPLSWLEAISTFQADVSGGANFAYDLCVDALARAEKPTFDLSRLRLAFSGAEPVRASTIDRFSEAFAGYGFRRQAFYPCYGLAEATLMVSGPDAGVIRPRIVEFHDGRQLVSCGTPCQGMTLEIVDVENGDILPEGGEGEIRIAGSSVSRGYWRQEESHPLCSMMTGDLGIIRDGELFITGRLKDLIIIRGRNIDPSDIEGAMAMCHPALAPAAAAAFPIDKESEEGFVVAAEIRREHRRDANWAMVFAAMRRRIAEQTGLTPADIVLLRPGTLARTTSGKIRRQACREAYLAGRWAPLAQSGNQSGVDEVGVGASRRMAAASRVERWASIHDYLIWRLAQLTATPEVFLTPDAGLDIVGLDSLKQVEFALLVERDLNVMLPADWIDHAPTLSDLADELQALRDNPAKPNHEVDLNSAATVDRYIPMTPRQLEFFAGGPAHPEQFAEILYFRTPKGASVDALKRAIAESVNLHDAFSLRFGRSGNDGVVCEDIERHLPAFKRIDVSKMDKSGHAKTRSEVLKGILDGFSLNDGTLVSAMLIDQGEAEQGLLAVGFHHLVVDAVSLSVWAVRFQHAYADVIAGRNLSDRSPEGQYVPWLRALEAYGHSSDLARELDYWRETCGIDGGQRPYFPSTDTGVWRSNGKTTLPAEENQQFLRQCLTPLSRHAAVLAALCQAWSETTGDSAPLVMIESHGRHPFPGTDPSRAVGWFAVRHPIGMQFQHEIEAVDLVGNAEMRLRSVPKLGHGYSLLLRRSKGDPLRDHMEMLRRPSLLLQYRGNVDDTFRKDTVLPVIAVHHEARAQIESSRRLGNEQSLAVVAGLSDGVLYWSVFFRVPDLEKTAQEISDGMRGFFTELSSH